MAGTLSGGKRDRMILESIYRWVESYLQTNGWLDTNRQHSPVTMTDEYPDAETEVPFNTLAVSMGDTFQSRVEMGSNAEERFQAFFLDFYGESDAVTRHLLGDLYAYINQQMTIPVYDYDKATPTIDFYLQVNDESVEIDYAFNVTNPWQKHWATLGFVGYDERDN